jgi:hypothetical protein
MRRRWEVKEWLKTLGGLLAGADGAGDDFLQGARGEVTGEGGPSTVAVETLERHLERRLASASALGRV